MNAPKIRLLIVDDHPLLLSGLCLLLNAEPDMEVVGQTDSAGKALALAAELAPDVVLLDISLHDASGLELLPKLLHQTPTSRIIMLTMHEDQQYLKEALGKGASGFLLKKGLDVDLLSAIRSVMRGEKYIHPALMTELLA
ncbi:MAG TPA: response regulator transcription factor, partial [Desulfurivibrionaceae bacterium]|nr:response regulator transcription factor [Desulfurivibrionaceae bacterium]